MTDSPRIDTLLLDVDGTIIDSTYHHAVAWFRAFGAHGVDVELWRVHKAIGMGGDKLPAHVAGQAVEDELGDALRQRWEEEYEPMRSAVRLLPGARQVIDDAKALGLKVALASSGKQSYVDGVLEMLPGVELDAVTTSDDADASKPDPDILGIALERSGGRHALVIGDTTWDAEAAGRLGAPMIGVRSGGFADAELREAGAIDVVDDLAGIVLRDVV